MSKKIYAAELSCSNYNKPVSKIQKFKKTVPKLNKKISKNNVNGELVNMGLSLLVDGNSTLKKGVHYTSSNINISNNVNNNYKNTMYIKDGLNNKIKNNENQNSKSNIKKNSRNLNNNNSVSKTNEKIISSYNNKSVKNYNSLMKKKTSSLNLHKSKSKGKI